MKMRSASLLSLALAVCLSSVMVAQDQGGGRGRGGPGGAGRGGFGGMGMSMGSALDLMSLLRTEEVQKEVGLSPEAFKAVQEAMPDLRSLFQGDESERPAKLKEANAKAQELIDEALTPKQQTRLLGLLVQQRGMSAVTNEMVAKQIGLDAAKSEEIKAIVQKSGKELGEKMREAFSGGAGGDREKMRETMQNMTKERDEEIAAKLSDDQKEKLEALKGDAFTFPERRGFGGGQGGGGPGAGGGRNRGGGNNN